MGTITINDQTKLVPAKATPADGFLTYDEVYAGWETGNSVSVAEDTAPDEVVAAFNQLHVSK